uniref:Uncharacterized protein n=1 Tax=Lepeophtheirus salmonis TaxID=72036 RepID=A0A0K2TVW1_LEPSM
MDECSCLLPTYASSIHYQQMSCEHVSKFLIKLNSPKASFSRVNFYPVCNIPLEFVSTRRYLAMDCCQAEFLLMKTK